MDPLSTQPAIQKTAEAISMYLQWIDYGLMAAGMIVVGSALAAWRRTGWRDPLRGAPHRTNHINGVVAYLCIMVYLFSPLAAQWIAPMLAPESYDGKTLKMWSGIFGMNVTQIAITAFCLIMAASTFRLGIRGFGWGRLSLKLDVIYAVKGLLAIFALCGVTLIVTEWLTTLLQYDPPIHDVYTLLEKQGTTWLVWLLTLAGAMVLAPVGEEMFFRGFLQTGLQKLLLPKWGTMHHRWFAIAASSLVFGVVHLGTPHFIPALIEMGLILGFLYERTGSLRVTILIHAMFNTKSILWRYFALYYGG